METKKRKYNSAGRIGKTRGTYNKKPKASSQMEEKPEIKQDPEITPEPEVKIEPVKEEPKDQVPAPVADPEKKEEVKQEENTSPEITNNTGQTVFDNFVEQNTAPAPETKEGEEKKKIVYKLVENEEEIAARESSSETAKQSFREIAAKKGRMFNTTMLIAAMDFLFPKLLKLFYKYVKGDARIDQIDLSEVKLTDAQIESLGESAEAMAEYVFQYINPAVMFVIGIMMHYDSNITNLMNKVGPPEPKKKAFVYAGQRGA